MQDPIVVDVLDTTQQLQHQGLNLGQRKRLLLLLQDRLSANVWGAHQTEQQPPRTIQRAL